MSIDGWGARIGRFWVQLYTSRLAEDHARERRDEILSDLWEHQIDSEQSGHSRIRHNLEVIERVLSGIPADLSWRRGIQRSQLRPDKGDPMTTQHEFPRSTVVLIIAASLGIFAPFPFLALLGTGLETAEMVWVIGSIALAGVLAAGLVLRIKAERATISTVLMVVGAFAPTAAWFWIPPVYLLTAVIIVTAIVTSRDRPVIQPTIA